MTSTSRKRAKGALHDSSGVPRELPGDEESRARVESIDASRLREEREKKDLDVVADCSYPANAAPPNLPAAARAEDTPEPRLDLSFPMSRRNGQCATRWRAHFCRGAAVKSFFSRAREHHRQRRTEIDRNSE